MTSAPDPAPTPTGPGGNVYDKYGTRNPIARALMAGFFRDLDDLMASAGPATMIEAGCGEGYLSARYAARLRRLDAFDIDADCVESARARLADAAPAVSVFQADLIDAAATLPPADLVLCCEVLEHVHTPEVALDRLHDLSARYVIVSVPREPLWRIMNMARLKYLGAFGNTPGHVQHWSARAFRDLIGRRFTVLKVRQPPPWTMILAEREM
jgi:SAM-dependent methyltransferase